MGQVELGDPLSPNSEVWAGKSPQQSGSPQWLFPFLVSWSSFHSVQPSSMTFCKWMVPVTLGPIPTGCGMAVQSCWEVVRFLQDSELHCTES
jgi:hypothetical protein